MLRMKPITDAKAAAAYYSKSDGGYYTKDAELHREWGGKAAAILGLEGAPDPEQFENLLNGLHPRTGKQLSSSLCRQACYATKHRYRFPRVRERLQWCLEQSRMDDFSDRMVREIRTSGVLVLRVHCSGDYYDKDYAEKWLRVMKACPRVRFYGYTRSWRVPEIAEVLEKMAALRCAKVWYSIDSETGGPDAVPRGVRLAYLQMTKDGHPEQADLVFRIRKLRGLPACLSSAKRRLSKEKPMALHVVLVPGVFGRIKCLI